MDSPTACASCACASYAMPNADEFSYSAAGIWTPINILNNPTHHPKYQIDRFMHFHTTMPQTSTVVCPVSTPKLHLPVGNRQSQLPASSKDSANAPPEMTTRSNQPFSRHTYRPIDSTSMNEECVAVDAVGSMPKLQLRVDHQVCYCGGPLFQKDYDLSRCRSHN